MVEAFMISTDKVQHLFPGNDVESYRNHVKKGEKIDFIKIDFFSFSLMIVWLLK